MNKFSLINKSYIFLYYNIIGINNVNFIYDKHFIHLLFRWYEFLLLLYYI